MQCGKTILPWQLSEKTKSILNSSAERRQRQEMLTVISSLWCHPRRRSAAFVGRWQFKLMINLKNRFGAAILLRLLFILFYLVKILKANLQLIILKEANPRDLGRNPWLMVLPFLCRRDYCQLFYTLDALLRKQAAQSAQVKPETSYIFNMCNMCCMCLLILIIADQSFSLSRTVHHIFAAGAICSFPHQPQQPVLTHSLSCTVSEQFYPKTCDTWYYSSIYSIYSKVGQGYV